MTTSPARAHRMRHIAAAVAAANAPVDASLATGYEMVLAQLTEHRRQLKQVQSVERKAEVKRRFLPEYSAYIAGALQADHGGQDDVLMTLMVWRIDTGDYTGALHIAEYAIRHKLSMPDQYKRDTPCLIAEEFAEAALKSRSGGTAFDPAVLIGAELLTAAQDMPDEVRAKLHKAIGYALRDAAELQPEGPTLDQLYQVRSYLERAMGLHEKVGVKKDIERLDTKINALTHAAAPAGDSGTTNPPAPLQDGAG